MLTFNFAACYPKKKATKKTEALTISRILAHNGYVTKKPSAFVTTSQLMTNSKTRAYSALLTKRICCRRLFA
jgi:hypothetical protein